MHSIRGTRKRPAAEDVGEQGSLFFFPARRIGIPLVVIGKQIAEIYRILGYLTEGNHNGIICDIIDPGTIDLEIGFR